MFIRQSRVAGLLLLGLALDCELGHKRLRPVGRRLEGCKK